MSWIRYKELEETPPEIIKDFSSQELRLEIDYSSCSNLKLTPTVGFRFRNSFGKRLVTCFTEHLSLFFRNFGNRRNRRSRLLLYENKTGIILTDRLLANEVVQVVFVGRRRENESSKQIIEEFIINCESSLRCLKFVLEESKIVLFEDSKLLTKEFSDCLFLTIERIEENIFAALANTHSFFGLSDVVFFFNPRDSGYSNFTIKSTPGIQRRLFDMGYWKKKEMIVLLSSSSKPTDRYSELLFRKISEKDILAERFIPKDGNLISMKMTLPFQEKKKGLFVLINEKEIALIVRPVHIDVIDLRNKCISKKIDVDVDYLNLISSRYILFGSVGSIDSKKTLIYDISSTKTIAKIHISKPLISSLEARIFGVLYESNRSRIIVWREGSIDGGDQDPFFDERMEFFLRRFCMELKDDNGCSVLIFSFGNLSSSFNIPKLFFF